MLSVTTLPLVIRHPGVRVNVVWHRVLELAWEAFRAGTLPIVAAVTNRNDELVAEGRSHRHEQVAAPGQIANACIAHAEGQSARSSRPGSTL